MNSKVLLTIFILILGAGTTFAQDTAFRSTAYPLPRFVSLASGEINVRTGPGEKYPVKWVYSQKHRPVEVILEYDNWRKIKDMQGEEGWVHSTLLSGRRTGITQGPDYIPLRARPGPNGKLRVRLEKGVIARLKECRPDWCKAEIQGYKGWIDRKFIWGLYDKENFE